MPKFIIDGTAGGEHDIRGDFKQLQLTFSGRSTGTLTVQFRGTGGDVFEDFDPPMAVDLSATRTVVTPEPAAIEALKFTVSAAGADIVTTWSQRD